jgi:acyl-CoA thioester hydrolase
MLAVHTGATAGEDLTEGVVVVQHDLEFVTPLVFRAAPVRIETWVTQLRAASFTLAYEILDVDPDGTRRVYTRASTLLSPYVFVTERPRRLTPQEREVLARFQVSDDASGP